MALEISKTDVWVGSIEDRPGALAGKLETLQRGGANMDFVLVRPSDNTPGTGVMFVAPLQGPQQTKAATEAGLRKSATMHVLRVTGPDRPGLGAALARALAGAGLNVGGVSAAAIGGQAICYFRFASDADAQRAAQTLTAAKLG
jgi:predicted amino acid-binding ACT domain protein